MASRELKSTDVGAPQLVGNTKNSLNAVLKAALVNGYGETAPLGWDLIYEELDQGVCVFRPKIGSRMFLQIIDDNSFGNGRLAKAQSYESMQSAFIGVMPCMPDNITYIHKIYNSATLSVPWHIIGDERGFYLLTRAHYNASVAYKNSVKIAYFGQGVSTEDPDYTSKYNWLQWTLEQYDTTNNISQTMTIYMMRHPVTRLRGPLAMSTLTSIGGLAAGGEAIGARCNGSIGGTYGYVPIRNVARSNIFSCNFPGLFEPLFVYGTPYKRQQILYEEIDDSNTIVSFPSGPLLVNSNFSAYIDSRLSFLIGDKFRDVF